MRNGLFIVQFHASHHTSSSHTWLDVCAIDTMDKVLSSGQISIPFLSGHDLIYVVYAIRVESAKRRIFVYRDIKNIEVDAFNNDLLALD